MTTLSFQIAFEIAMSIIAGALILLAFAAMAIASSLDKIERNWKRKP